MKIFKNLFGKNAKIHVDEIATKIDGVKQLLSFAIISSFSFSDSGNYVKFGNGFMICWHRFPEPTAPTRVFGSGFVNEEREITLPQNFSHQPVTYCGNLFGGRYASVTNQGLSNFKYVICSLTSSTTSATSYYISFGRWK